MHKVSSPLLGAITEEGFIAKKLKVDASSGAEMLEYGAVQHFYARTERMRAQLSSVFPARWKRIYNIALLGMIYELRLKRIGMEFKDSMLLEVYPHLALSGGLLSKLLRNLGKRGRR